MLLLEVEARQINMSDMKNNSLVELISKQPSCKSMEKDVDE